jgi:DNA-binding NarL/FixJ family response regulator
VFAAQLARARGGEGALFVTVKTVELHLSNAYRKLALGSRRELAAVLAVGA